MIISNFVPHPTKLPKGQFLKCKVFFSLRPIFIEVKFFESSFLQTNLYRTRFFHLPIFLGHQFYADTNFRGSKFSNVNFYRVVQWFQRLIYLGANLPKYWFLEIFSEAVFPSTPIFSGTYLFKKQFYGAEFSLSSIFIGINFSKAIFLRNNFPETNIISSQSSRGTVFPRSTFLNAHFCKPI